MAVPIFPPLEVKVMLTGVWTFLIKSMMKICVINSLKNMVLSGAETGIPAKITSTFKRLWNNETDYHSPLHADLFKNRRLPLWNRLFFIFTYFKFKNLIQTQEALLKRRRLYAGQFLRFLYNRRYVLRILVRTHQITLLPDLLL